MARWETQNTATNLIHAAPFNPWKLPGIALWIFLVIQIVVFPILGALVERRLFGTSNGKRMLSTADPGVAVKVTGFTKRYQPNWFSRNILSHLTRKQSETVVAVNDLNLTVLPGQIMVLLGANGRLVILEA